MSTRMTEQRLKALEERMEEIERRQRETAVHMLAGVALLQGHINELDRQQAETQTILLAGAAVLVMAAREFAADLGAPGDAEMFDDLLGSLGDDLSESSTRLEGLGELVDAIRARLPRHGLRLVTVEEGGG